MKSVTFQPYKSPFAPEKKQKGIDEVFGFVLPLLDQVLSLFSDIFDDFLAFVFQFIHFVLKTEFFLLHSIAID